MSGKPEGSRTIAPDVDVTRRPSETPRQAGGALTITEPIVIELRDDPITEAYLEIIDTTSGEKVVTAIELLSPTNKLPGDGNDLYTRKQREYRAAKVNQVEIDLTRSGNRDLVFPMNRIPIAHKTTYLACVRRGDEPLKIAEDIDSHVAQCDSCRAELLSFGRLRNLVSASSLDGAQPPPWAAIAAQLQAEQVTLPSKSPSARTPQSNVKDVLVIVASLAASFLIFSWARRASDESTQVADSGRRHHADHSDHAMNATAINFQDTVSLQQQDTGLAMQALVQKYAGREASVDEVVKNVGFRPMVQSPLPGGATLVSTQILTLPQCNCVEGECMCGPSDCNCVACVCQRPDGSTFLVIEQCNGQKVNFGELPVQLVHRGNHELQVTGNEKGLAVAWTANQTRKIAFGLRDLSEMDQLLVADRSVDQMTLRQPGS